MLLLLCCTWGMNISIRTNGKNNYRSENEIDVKCMIAADDALFRMESVCIDKLMKRYVRRMDKKNTLILLIRMLYFPRTLSPCKS